MGSGESLHAVETVILLLLVLVAGFAVLARRLRVPYPIVLVLAGQRPATTQTCKEPLCPQLENLSAT